MSGYNVFNPTQLKDAILRRLGAPVICINVTEDQIYDCIQRALELYGEYHFSGLHKGYKVFYVGTDEEYRNGIFDMSNEGVFAVTQILRTNMGSITSMDGNATYPWFSDFLLGMAGINGGAGSSCSKFYGPNAFGGDLGYFTQMMQYRTMMQDMLSPLPDFWYNADTGKLSVKGTYRKGDIIICEVYVKSYIDTDQMLGNAGYGVAQGCGNDNPWSLHDTYMDPRKQLTPRMAGEVTPPREGAYNNRWVKDMSTALVKELWGEIMFKHQGLQLPGGVTVDGATLKAEATEKIRELREELELLDPPVGVLVG